MGVEPPGACLALTITQADPEVESLSRNHPISRRELDVAGKKRPKSLSQTQKKAPAKPKRPKKTSRGK
jgi:hypothetical protein